jgi:hypothetical protein
MIDIAYVLIGILMVTLGRRLFWLFVGGVGFVAGLQIAHMFFVSQPYWVGWAMALVCGVIGTLLALFFQTIAIGLGGFAAGSTISAYVAVAMGVAAVPWISLIGGILGTILMYLVFDWALIGLSSVAGAMLIVHSLNWNPRLATILFIVLIASGIWFQTALWHKQKPNVK